MGSSQLSMYCIVLFNEATGGPKKGNYTDLYFCVVAGSPDGAKLKLYAQAFKHHLGK